MNERIGSKTAESILMEFSDNLQISPVGDPVKFDYANKVAD